ncbi:hypothetical protein LguiA_008906 [Lonicera macranthoides]
MSAVVGEWIGEVAKLREKVMTKKYPFFLKSQRRSSMEEEEDENEKRAVPDHKPSSSVAQLESKKEDTIMSESTVCLLMDRFVLW